MERWRRAWREGGECGVAAKGSPDRPRLSDGQIARPERQVERGPLVHGWADQRRTPARVKTLIGRLFHVSYTGEGTWRLLKQCVAAASGSPDDRRFPMFRPKGFLPGSSRVGDRQGSDSV